MNILIFNFFKKIENSTIENMDVFNLTPTYLYEPPVIPGKVLLLIISSSTNVPTTAYVAS